MPFSSMVILSDPTNAGGSSNDAVLVYDLQQALNIWSQYITGLGTLVVSFNVENTAVGRADGGPTSYSFVNTTSSGLNIFEPSSLYELTTGQHVANTTSDITIHIDPGYFKFIDLAPNLTVDSSVPDNVINPIFVFLHELEHGFGMSGFYNQNGTLSGKGESLYDQYIQITSASNTAFFTGPAAEAAYGGPVPLTTASTTQNYYHFGNTLSDFGKTPATVQDPLTLDLMNGIVFINNYHYKVSALDLGVLKDLGYNISAPNTLVVSSISAVSDTKATNVTTGHVVTVTLALSETVTVSGVPTLQLNDNEVASYQSGSGSNILKFAYTVQPSDQTLDLQVTGINLASSSIHDALGNSLSSVQGDLGLQINENGISIATIQNDYFAITRTTLPTNQATSITAAISAGSQTETSFVNSLFSQVANTTFPAVAVEASMYGAVGSSNEVTALATQFLPPQVANAINHGYNPLVYASDALGLAFAFNNENGSPGFANNFGPSHPGTPNSAAGDASFAAAASAVIFGTVSTPILVNAIQGYVANWKAFYTANGIPGNSRPSADQADLAARGAAWGDAVGLALANNLGPLPDQVTNFLDDAAQGSAVYAVSLIGQPAHHAFA